MNDVSNGLQHNKLKERSLWRYTKEKEGEGMFF